MLPVTLPPLDDFRPAHARPRRRRPPSPSCRCPGVDWWATVELDLGDGPKRYQRELNVMPQWAGSCWYELRYLDPTNENRFVDPEVERYWMGPQAPGDPGGVDLYVGGVEHAVLHLLYARFWHKVLYDLGEVSSCEPYRRLFNQGYILAAAYKDEREIYVDAHAVDRGGRRHLHLRGPAGHPRVGEDGQEPEERRRPRRHLRRVRRRHAAPLRDVDGSVRHLAPVEHPGHRRATTASCSGCGATWSTSAPVPVGSSTTAPADDETRGGCCTAPSTAVAADYEGLRFNTAVAKLIELNNHLTRSRRRTASPARSPSRWC